MKVTIETYSQFFTITALNFSKLIFMLHDFNKDLVTYKMVLKRVGNGRLPVVTSEIDKVLYIIENENPENKRTKNLIRYPISLLEDIQTNLKLKDDKIIFKIKHHRHHNSLDIDINRDMLRTPRDYQTETINKLVKWKDNNTIISLQTGRGKAQALTSLIRIPNGWCHMGDIKVNDLVIGKDGKETKVTGVYPQGKLQLLKVTFEDGRFVKVCKEHLWAISSLNFNKDIIKSRKVVNTETIISYLKEYDKSEDIIFPYYIDLIEPEDFGENNLDIEPYDYGKKIIMNDNILSIHNDYLTSSVEHRYDLLSGILNKTKKEINMYYTFLFLNRENLSKDIQLLVRGLGGKCTITKINNEFKLKIDIRCNDNIDRYLKITNVVEAEIEEAQCISVDNKDKLYVTNDYIVTHNTLIAAYTLCEIKKRFMVLILPRFIDKWIKDIVELTDIEKDEIFVIQGIKGIADVILRPKLYINYKCFILSITSINIFMKAYLDNTLDRSLGLSPSDITKNLGIDIVLNDEAHMEFFNVYKFRLFSNHRMTLGLSATLVNRDKRILKMYELGFPKVLRIENIVPINKYILTYSVRFKFNSPKRIIYKNHFGYNQSVFEKSIIKNNNTLRNYVSMLISISNSIFYKRRVGNEKIIIFIGTVKLCKIVASYFSDMYKDLNVGTYTEEDDLEVINGYNVIVTTVGSLGTAIDVKDLISVIQTVNVDSLQTNLQTIGRLRERTDKSVIFAYTWTADIRSHIGYNKNRITEFRKVTKSVNMIDYKPYV